MRSLFRILFSLILMMGLLAGMSTMAYADVVAKIGNQTYESLTDAIKAAQSGNTITMVANDTVNTSSSNSRLAISKSLTIDGSGHTITINNRGFGVGMNASGNIDVTFKNVTIQNNVSNGRCIDTRGNLNSLTLDGVTLKAAGEATQPLTIGGNQTTAATVFIKGSTIQTMDDGSYGYAITTFNPVNMTIDNSIIKGWACLNIKGPSSSAGSSGSTFTIKNNSKLVSKNVYPGTSNAYGVIKVEDVNINVYITDTAIETDGAQNSQAIVSFESGALNNAKVTMGEGNKVTFSGNGVYTHNDSNTAVLVISGGIFNKDVPVKHCASGYAVFKYTGDEKYNFIVLPVVTVTFIANGGSGTMEPQMVSKGDKFTLPQCTFTGPDGKLFAGWKVGDHTYSAGDTLTVNTNLTVSAIWEEAQETRVNVEELDEVPVELKEEYPTVQKIKSALLSRMIVSGITATMDQTEFFDMELQFSSDGGKTWVKATKDNFPKGGITVRLDYPKGTNRNGYRFSVAHMLTVSMNGMKAGEIETPEVRTTEKMIEVTLNGLSPVAISWQKVDNQPGANLPQTGDGSNPLLYIGMMLIALAGIGMLMRKRK